MNEVNGQEYFLHYSTTEDGEFFPILLVLIFPEYRKNQGRGLNGRLINVKNDQGCF